jgi:lipopolysaccharide biosynthesis regulator YciM
VDRAIRIHQNLIARPQLAKEYRLQALSELGQDYLSAGVLDRAEGLFQELVELGVETVASLKYLLHIYQQEKDWQQAIITAQKLASCQAEPMNGVIAQYYCELALQAKTTGEGAQVLKYLKKAISADSACVRASIIRAHFAMAHGQYREAIRYFQKVRDQNANFLSEVIAPLCQCYRQLNDERGMVTYLNDCLQHSPRISIVLALSEHIQHTYDEQAAIEFIAQQIQRHPSLRGLKHLVELYLRHAHGDTKDKLSLLDNLMVELLANKPVYQCAQCGFSSQSMFWLCPKCHHWDSIQPIQGIEGS